MLFIVKQVIVLNIRGAMYYLNYSVLIVTISDDIKPSAGAENDVTAEANTADKGRKIYIVTVKCYSSGKYTSKISYM